MGIFSAALIVGAIGTGVAVLVKDSIKEQKRKNTPCLFDNGISQDTFNLIVKDACKTISRVSDFDTKGPVIVGKVRSQSGISEWSFKIDFNDYGKVTGKYWLSSKNEQSQIPETIAKKIQGEIEIKLEELE